MISRPPICQGCVQPSAVYFTLVAGGVAQTHACCQGCPALSQGVILPSVALGLKLAVPMPAGRGKCPTCGFRWADFDRTHRLGCATCYETHAPMTMATLARIQPGLEHQGRRPQGSIADVLGKLAKAKEQLSRALSTEDYETAAALRDAIAELEAGRPPAPPGS